MGAPECVLCVSGAPLCHVIILWALAYFLVQPHVPSSSCTFLSQPWNQPFFQRALLSLCGEWYLGTKSWVLGFLIATGVLLLTVPLSRQVQVHIYIDFYTCWKPRVYTFNSSLSLLPSFPFFILVTPSAASNLLAIILSVLTHLLKAKIHGRLF